jgi:hypothetical protein
MRISSSACSGLSASSHHSSARSFAIVLLRRGILKTGDDPIALDIGAWERNGERSRLRTSGQNYKKPSPMNPEH